MGCCSGARQGGAHPGRPQAPLKVSIRPCGGSVVENTKIHAIHHRIYVPQLLRKQADAHLGHPLPSIEASAAIAMQGVPLSMTVCQFRSLKKEDKQRTKKAAAWKERKGLQVKDQKIKQKK